MSREMGYNRRHIVKKAKRIEGGRNGEIKHLKVSPCSSNFSLRLSLHRDVNMPALFDLLLEMKLIL